MIDPSLSEVATPLGGRLDTPYHDLGPPGEGPAAALVAGVHGNEVNGVFVLSRLADLLGRAARGEHPSVALHRRVVVVPAVNVLGINTGSRLWPFDDADLNRVFPGDPEGAPPARIARRLLEVTMAARDRVDIHSSNPAFEELPQVRLYAPNDDERASAFLFGLPAVVERPMNAVFTRTLGHAWRRHGGESFVIQAGRAGDLQLAHCERLFQALINFLRHKGVISGGPVTDVDEDVHLFGLHQGCPVISERAGLFVSHLDVGRWVRRGEVLGHVYDPWDGQVLAEVTAPVGGLLSGLRRRPLLCEGDLLARIQTREGDGEVVDTYLHGHGQ